MAETEGITKGAVSRSVRIVLDEKCIRITLFCFGCKVTSLPVWRQSLFMRRNGVRGQNKRQASKGIPSGVSRNRCASSVLQGGVGRT